MRTDEGTWTRGRDRNIDWDWDRGSRTEDGGQGTGKRGKRTKDGLQEM